MGLDITMRPAEWAAWRTETKELSEALAIVKQIHPPPWVVESRPVLVPPVGPAEWSSEIVDANSHGVWSHDDYDDEQYQAMCDGFNLACERLE